MPKSPQKLPKIPKKQAKEFFVVVRFSYYLGHFKCGWGWELMLYFVLVLSMRLTGDLTSVTKGVSRGVSAVTSVGVAERVSDCQGMWISISLLP